MLTLTLALIKKESSMPQPVILIVDDDEQVLNAVERDLRRHYRGDYRVLKASSGIAALEVIRQLKQRNDALALMIVDQRMPELTGTKFLEEAIRFYPQARRVLLTAYADTEVAIMSINQLGLDYYLLKPWDPPEHYLYPVLDDLLNEWLATVHLPYEGIRVAGTLWSPESHHVKDFLFRSRIPYQWMDIERDSEARALVDALMTGTFSLPVVFFPDGSTLIKPTLPALAQKIGLHTQASGAAYDLIIIGAGPAGLGAAVYGASEGFRTALIEREATGGQAGTSSRIENYLGFPLGISGMDFARRATDQAIRLGAEILTTQEVVKIRVEETYRSVTLLDGTELSCKALVIASGVTVRRLDAPGVAQFTGAGVYYGAAVTEAAYYEGQPVFIVGGANSAGQGAMLLSRYASQVTMLVRSSSLAVGMSRYLIDQIEATPNIAVLTDTEVEEVQGGDQLERITYKNKATAKKVTAPAAVLFLFIGAVPHTAMVVDVVQCNRAGFILTGPELMKDGKPPAGWPLRRDPYLLETNVPGIFAAGDVRQGAVRRVASAVGEGAIAISLVQQYMRTV
jgi:thioredoxin reductase (NADPH)